MGIIDIAAPKEIQIPKRQKFKKAVPGVSRILQS
jgi:hypothetical protein